MDEAASASPGSISVSVTLLSQMFHYLASLNVDADPFLRSLGLDPALLKSPDGYIPVETYLLIQDEAARYTNDPSFGLHMGKFAEPGSWSILGYLMMNCKTLGEAVEKSARYSRIIGNQIEARGELHFNKAKVIYFTPPHAPQMSHHCYESAIASSWRMMRLVSGQPICPLEVTFSHPAPASTAEYVEFFGCPVYFSRPDNSFTLDIRLGAIRVPMANPALLAYFENYARDFLAEMERKDAVTQEVTRIILARLDDEKLSIDNVAKQMAVSVRTLQKRLEGEGVVFSELLRDVRQRLAMKYLRENYSVEQITYMLGFSEPSVFRKAFKKWSGVTPKEYRDTAGFSIRNNFP